MSDGRASMQAPLDRRGLLKWTTAAAAAAMAGPTAAGAQPGTAVDRPPRMVGYMLAHEQFAVPQLVQIGTAASRAGFDLLATSDHLQPWEPSEGHAGQAWVTLGALTGRVNSWMGTTVTCPTFRYNPAVVAEAFASLSLLHPGRVFLTVGSGEALNEQAATGYWPLWPERWERLIEAIGIIRALWTGSPVSHRGRHYSVDARLYDPPVQPIPLFTAANGRKSMRLAGYYGDGLVTDPKTWKQHKQEWHAGARDAGKDPAEMPVLVEQYVVVGDRGAARRPAELWRFGPKAFKEYYNIPSPAVIERRADIELPIEQVIADWAVSPDPAVHIRKIEELFATGVSIVNIHSGQSDQNRVIEFYGSQVLPAVRQRQPNAIGRVAADR